MKKRLITWISIAALAAGSFMQAIPVMALNTDNATAVPAEEKTASDRTEMSRTIFFLDSSAAGRLAVPAGSGSYQIPTDGFRGNVTFTVISGSRYVKVSPGGLVTPRGTTYYYKDGIGVTNPDLEEGESVPKGYTVEVSYQAGTAVVRASDGNVTKDYTITTADYANENAEHVLQTFADNTLAQIDGKYDKLVAITKYVAENYNYNAGYSSYEDMIANGGGDCYGSTDMILRLCEMSGIEARLRNGNMDAGAGSGHRNVIARIDGKYYVADAGFVGSAPRYYYVKEETDGWFVSIKGSGEDKYAQILQYDGFDEEVTVPSTYKGYPVKIIGRGNGKGVFGYCDRVTKLTIPASVVKINSGALYHLTDSQEFVVDPDNPNYMSYGGCVYSKDGTKLIGAPQKITSVPFTDNVTTIGEAAFPLCGDLGYFALPETVTTLERTIFYAAHDFTVYVPPTVTDIDENAFTNCYSYLILCDSGSAMETFAGGKNLDYITTDLSDEKWTVSSSESEIPAGSEEMPEITVKYGTRYKTKTVLKEGKDYTVDYKADPETGTVTAEIAGSGLYSGTRTLTFTYKKRNITAETINISTDRVVYNCELPESINTQAKMRR